MTALKSLVEDGETGSVDAPLVPYMKVDAIELDDMSAPMVYLKGMGAVAQEHHQTLYDLFMRIIIMDQQAKEDKRVDEWGLEEDMFSDLGREELEVYAAAFNENLKPEAQKAPYMGKDGLRHLPNPSILEEAALSYDYLRKININGDYDVVCRKMAEVVNSFTYAGVTNIPEIEVLGKAAFALGYEPRADGEDI